MYIDEIDNVAAADPATPWGTADNYNQSHPFPAIDHVTIAVGAIPNNPLAAPHTPVR
jgi:hypothetical protein